MTAPGSPAALVRLNPVPAVPGAPHAGERGCFLFPLFLRKRKKRKNLGSLETDGEGQL